MQRLSNQAFGVRWEDDLAAVLRRPPSVALDVGANAGQTARRLLERFPGLHVYSFEPHPEALTKLQALAAREPSLEVIAAAASDGGGELELVLTPFNQHSTVTRAPRPGERTVNVATTRLDAFCMERGIRQVSLLKLDVEGHEIAALKGAMGLLNERRVDAILVECEFEQNAEQPHGNFFDIHHLVAEHDYRVVAFYPGGVDGNGWQWGDVLYRLRSDGPTLEGPFR